MLQDHHSGPGASMAQVCTLATWQLLAVEVRVEASPGREWMGLHMGCLHSGHPSPGSSKCSPCPVDP